MKKKIILFLTIFSTIFSLTNSLRANILDYLRVDFGFEPLFTQDIANLSGPYLGLGMDTEYFNLYLTSRVFVDIGQMSSVDPNTTLQPYYSNGLRLEFKYPLQEIGMTILGGIGAFYTFSDQKASFVEADFTKIVANPINPAVNPSNGSIQYEAKLGGVAFELSAGVLYPLMQYISVVGRINGVFGHSIGSFFTEASKDNPTEYKLEKAYSVNLAGASIQLAIRFAFAPTVRLKY